MLQILFQFFLLLIKIVLFHIQFKLLFLLLLLLCFLFFFFLLPFIIRLLYSTTMDDDDVMMEKKIEAPQFSIDSYLGWRMLCVNFLCHITSAYRAVASPSRRDTNTFRN